MSVEKVILSSDAYKGLLAHSFVTDEEEVLALLFGDIQNTSVRIWGSLSVQRNCKEKDRVEVEDVQLSAAIDQADELSNMVGQDCTLRGWFHSHPKITVLPSHVDLRTQQTLQSLSSEFVGLIISCFSRGATGLEKVELIAFQSTGEGKGRSIPVEISSQLDMLEHPLSMIKYDSLYYMLEVQKNLLEEEKKAYESCQSSNMLSEVYNSSLFNLAISRFLQLSLLPFHESIQQKQEMDRARLQGIEEENAALESKINPSYSLI